METVIETHALTKKFGDRAAVNGVDLTVPAGVAFGFLGPNGARHLYRKAGFRPVPALRAGSRRCSHAPARMPG